MRNLSSKINHILDNNNNKIIVFYGFSIDFLKKSLPKHKIYMSNLFDENNKLDLNSFLKDEYEIPQKSEYLIYEQFSKILSEKIFEGKANWLAKEYLIIENNLVKYHPNNISDDVDKKYDFFCDNLFDNQRLLHGKICTNIFITY